MLFVIRADGGPEIGYGHLVRTSALAVEVLSRGYQVIYATSTPESVDEVCPDDIDIIVLPSRSDPDPFVEQLDEVEVDVVFTDAYPVDTKYQRTVREQVPIAVLQDDDRHKVCADVFVNSNIYANNIEYDFVAPRPRTCLGANYVLLREEVQRLTKQELSWRDTPERAIISMGGSDTANITPTALRAFDGFSLLVDVIIGPGFSANQEAEIRNLTDDVSPSVRIHRNPDGLPDLMYKADFAVTTASTTIYELLAVGTPIVCLPVADNQIPIANTLRERNLAVVLPWEAGETAFREAIEEYVGDSQTRRERSTRGREEVDGRGTERVAAEVLSMADENGGV